MISLEFLDNFFQQQVASSRLQAEQEEPCEQEFIHQHILIHPSIYFNLSIYLHNSIVFYSFTLTIDFSQSPTCPGRQYGRQRSVLDSFGE